MPESPIRTKNQIRAEKAYNCIESFLSGHNRYEKEYRQLARSFPALVHSSGLVQAVAFVQAKEGEAGENYLKHLSTVMPLDPNKLKEKSRMADLVEYQRLTRDAMESASWLKRYAEALLKEI